MAQRLQNCCACCQVLQLELLEIHSLNGEICIQQLCALEFETRQRRHSAQISRDEGLLFKLAIQLPCTEQLSNVTLLSLFRTSRGPLQAKTSCIGLSLF